MEFVLISPVSVMIIGIFVKIIYILILLVGVGMFVYIIYRCLILFLKAVLDDCFGWIPERI